MSEENPTYIIRIYHNGSSVMYTSATPPTDANGVLTFTGKLEGAGPDLAVKVMLANTLRYTVETV